MQFTSAGKIVASGYQNETSPYTYPGVTPAQVDGWVIAQFTTSGTPDTSFGGGTGFFIPGYTGFGNEANALALQSNGDIVAVGSSGGGDPYLYQSDSPIDGSDMMVDRLTAAGAFDTTFGDGGFVTGRLGGYSGSANAMAVAPWFPRPKRSTTTSRTAPS